MKLHLMKGLRLIPFILLLAYSGYSLYYGMTMELAICTVALMALCGLEIYLNDKGYKDRTEEAVNHAYKEFAEVVRKRDEVIGQELLNLKAKIERQELGNSFKPKARETVSF